MAEKAYKFRLYPNKQQEELIRKTCGCARFVYNVTLAVRQAAYKAGAPLWQRLRKDAAWAKGPIPLAQRGRLYSPTVICPEYGPGLPKFLCLQGRLSQGEGYWFSEV